MNIGLSDFVSGAASVANSALSFGVNTSPGTISVDAFTAQRLSELQKALTEASAAGDIAKNKLLDERIKSTFRLGTRILALEKDKAAAVESEDFDTAKQLKMKIEELRKAQSGPGSGSPVAASRSSPQLPSFGAVQSSENLPPVDPLPAYFLRDYPQVVDSLGEDLISHLLSRDWRLREVGLQKLISTIKSTSNLSSVDWVMRRFVVEKIVSVMIKLCEVLQAIASVSADAVADTVEFVVIHLIEHRLVSSNRRLVDSVIETLVSVAQSSSARSQMVQHYLFKAPSSVSAIPNRCLTLLTMIEKLGFEGKAAMDVDELIVCLGEWLARSVSSDMRSAVIRVLAETVAYMGPARTELSILKVPSPLGEALLLELLRLPVRNPPSPTRGKAEAVACDFCGKKDEIFSFEAHLDMHFWSECSALIECSFCEQVVEITSLTEHRLKECENTAACAIDE